MRVPLCLLKCNFDKNGLFDEYFALWDISHVPYLIISLYKTIQFCWKIQNFWKKSATFFQYGHSEAWNLEILNLGPNFNCSECSRFFIWLQISCFFFYNQRMCPSPSYQHGIYLFSAIDSILSGEKCWKYDEKSAKEKICTPLEGQGAVTVLHNMIQKWVRWQSLVGKLL
jgi:hypothetical protein